MRNVVHQLLVFRPAPDRARWLHVVRTVLQAALFWAVFLVALPFGLHHVETAWLGLPSLSFPFQALIAGSLFGVGGTINLWSGATMAIIGRGTPFPLETARHLVIAGPYRFVRNPMALGGLHAGMGTAVFLASPTMAVAVVAGGVLWHTLARVPEEEDLLARFGEAYAAYRREVPLWIPRRRPWHQPPSENV